MSGDPSSTPDVEVGESGRGGSRVRRRKVREEVGATGRDVAGVVFRRRVREGDGVSEKGRGTGSGVRSTKSR